VENGENTPYLDRIVTIFDQNVHHILSVSLPLNYVNLILRSGISWGFLFKNLFKSKNEKRLK